MITLGIVLKKHKQNIYISLDLRDFLWEQTSQYFYSFSNMDKWYEINDELMHSIRGRLVFHTRNKILIYNEKT